MEYAYYLPLGFLPSFVWLLYFLKQDDHQEPKLIITEVFILGMISTFLAFLLQKTFIANASFGLNSGDFRFWFILAFIEEIAKFVFLYFRLSHEKEFDEIVDAMIYMVVISLGFAALENILYLSQIIPFQLPAILNLTISRFLGATIIHALSSAFCGYFWALSLLYHRNHESLVFLGLLSATVLHTFFNYSILNKEYFLTILLLVFSLIISGMMFRHLKNIRFRLIQE
ncbi:PrsW family intramembrane metalloprotease [Candidatus Azambacteria bacterium]|nr:PrsW family intramembrane metalloprotease [Candidatus Azambacteria bacterium]